MFGVVDSESSFLLAIYTYLSAIPCNPGPSGLDPALYEQNVCE